MEPAAPTPTGSSTVTESCISSDAPPPSASSQLLEISLISAQDLTPISKSMRTYAVAWIKSDRKQSTRTEQQGNRNPMWNEKFVFRLNNEIVQSENATLTVEIYTVSWFRDVLVGMVSVLISDLIMPLTRNPQNHTRFVALQVRRPSGNPQGILNMGVALLDSTMKSMPLPNYGITEKNENHHQDDDEKRELNAKIHLWRSLSVNNDDFPVKHNGSIVNGSMCNGSIIDNGSELCSDIGPSASIVAAELAKKVQPRLQKPAVAEETGSSILEELTIEEAIGKGYRAPSRDRWRTRQKDDVDEYLSELSGSCIDSTGSSDGGLFSCFGNAYGIEFRIVCGASKNARSSSRRKLKPSEAGSA